MKAHKPFKIRSKKDLERLYDGLYVAGQRLLDRHKPCNIQPSGTSDGEGHPLMTCLHYKKPNYCCCGGCKYLGKDGCTVEALECKLWVCSEVARQHPELKKRMYVLNRIAYKHDLLSFRASKEESIRFAMDLWRMV